MAASVTVPTTAPRALLRGLTAKQQAVAGVIAGRLTLLEAANQFGTVECGERVADPESLCRSVIGWVELALRDRPERAELLTEQLERELLLQFAHGGRLRVAP